MKKMTAMLLSLVMCFSLMAIPAQHAIIPVPEGPVIIDVGRDPADPGDDEPDEPGYSAQSIKLPEEQESVPVD